MEAAVTKPRLELRLLRLRKRLSGAPRGTGQVLSPPQNQEALCEQVPPTRPVGTEERLSLKSTITGGAWTLEPDSLSASVSPSDKWE